MPFRRKSLIAWQIVSTFSLVWPEWEETRVTWYLGANSDMRGDLVVASVQQLTRPEGLAELDRQHFDYVVIDEVHHARAPSCRRVMARLNATFTLGLTATPERTDGVDVESLFDDVLAWQATVGDGIAGGSLVPSHYLGLKDDVDFEQIPWRNGRFDPITLEEKLENSDSLSDFIEGKLQTICVVDLFNEGLDVPNVDRHILGSMLVERAINL